MKKGALIGLVCGIVVMGAAVIGAAAAVVLNTPSVKVARGVSKLFAEAAEHGEMFGEQFDFGKIQEIYGKGSYKNKVSVNMDIEGINDYAVSVDGTVLCDSINEKMNEEIKISLAYYELLSIQMAVDKTDVYVDIPALYDGSIVFDSRNIGEQYNNSIFAEYADEEIADDFSLDFFNQTVYDTDSGVKELLELIKNSEIKKDDSTVSAKVGSREVKCTGYLLTFKKDDINRFLKTLYVDAEETYEVRGDLELLLYMDRKNNIRQIETKKAIVTGGMTDQISVALRFAGETNVLETIKGKINAVEDGSEIEVNFDYSGIREGRSYRQTLQCKAKSELTDLAAVDYSAVWDLEHAGYDMDIEVDVADKNYKMELGGSVETDAYRFDMNFDDCALYMDREKVAGFDGSYSVEPLTEEIKIPSGETRQIFEFSELEFYSFVMEIANRLEDSYDLLDNFGNLF